MKKTEVTIKRNEHSKKSYTIGKKTRLVFYEF